MPRRRNKPKPRTTKRWVRKTNWLELPADITANILHRLGAVEILESAQKVCMAWRKICKDPAMWRVIDMHNCGDLSAMPYDLEKMCMHAINRSQGQLVDINIEYFATDELLEYIAERSSQLRRLEIACCYDIMDDESWTGFFKKVPLLEEIIFTFTDISEETIADVGRCCPMLKSFKYNLEYASYDDDFVIAIAKGMSQLRHLQLVGNKMTNKGLQAILDGCLQLESLDLRRCLNINLDGSLGKLCMEQIKNLRLPEDSMEGYKFVADDSEEHMMSGGNYDSELVGSSDYDDYEGLSDYEIYCGPHQNVFEDSNPGELSTFEEFLAVVQAMNIGNFSDSD